MTRFRNRVLISLEVWGVGWLVGKTKQDIKNGNGKFTTTISANHSEYKFRGGVKTSENKVFDQILSV